MKKIGARNLKTAISVVICLLIFRLFNRPYPFYACIAAVICTQNSVENSFLAGKNRMIGTIIGGIVGYILTVIFGNNPIITGIGVVLVIHIGNLLNKKESIVISCIVLLAIMTNLKEVGALEYALFRVLDTMIGIIVAIFVNKYILIEKLKYFS